MTAPRHARFRPDDSTPREESRAPGAAGRAAWGPSASPTEARSQAALGLVRIAQQAGAEILGVGIVIEKEFQGGGERLREKGVRVESLAIVSKIEEGVISFKG